MSSYVNNNRPLDSIETCNFLTAELIFDDHRTVLLRNKSPDACDVRLAIVLI
jgi:hypothetical protein